MARRFGKLVLLLRQRELGIRREWIDAAADREHQRPAHCGGATQILLAARVPPRGSPFTERAWTLEMGEEGGSVCRLSQAAAQLIDSNRSLGNRPFNAV